MINRYETKSIIKHETELVAEQKLKKIVYEDDGANVAIPVKQNHKVNISQVKKFISEREWVIL